MTRDAAVAAVEFEEMLGKVHRTATAATEDLSAEMRAMARIRIDSDESPMRRGTIEIDEDGNVTAVYCPDCGARMREHQPPEFACP